METILNTTEAVKSYLTDLSDSDLVNLWNLYCSESNYSDDEIYINDEDFFNTFFEGKVLEAVRAVSFGEYRYQDEYIKFNGYGNLETTNSPADEMDLDALAAAILEDPDTYDVELEEEEETQDEQ